MNRNHSLLLRKQLRQDQKEQPRKRRKKHDETAQLTSHSATDSAQNDSGDSSDELEDVELASPSGNTASGRESRGTETPEGQSTREASEMPEDSDGDEFEDLEDVDLDQIFAAEPKPQANETITISLGRSEEPEEAGKGKNRRKFVPVPKEERARRKLIHQFYLAAMVAHGVVRNKWCNDKDLHKELKREAPTEINALLNLAHMDVLDYVKSRRFIEGLRKALAFFNKKFRVTSQGLVRKDWENFSQHQERTDGRVSLTRFKRLIKAFRGSRDLGAQGFVALLRSFGVNARLVFSLQPPDYRSIVPAGAKNDREKEVKRKSKLSEFEPVFIPNLKQEFLLSSRGKPSATTTERQKFTFPTSKFPVFWIEAWNRYSKKWITIDPIVLNIVEVMPMRRKCKLEAPATDATSQTWYVLAYDSRGNVRDVTRRYTQYYNAKTVKKRIEFSSEEDENWYQRLLRAARPPSIVPTQADIIETKEFYDRDVCEGVPNNMTDFKNHPVYALESQLRQDEVIYPKDESSKCGSFRPMNKNTTMTVYKRSHVFRLRTAKAWYMRGRVLKVGVQPLRTKTVHRISLDEDDDDDGIDRLYAEFQTEMYRAPPIVDGKITKNAFGNLEIYTSTMMPDNGYLAKVSSKVTMRMLEKAARDILRIDYARAIVAFDFGGKKAKRTPTAREGGIVIDKQFQEAMTLVIEELESMEEEEKRKQVELSALRSWKFFMKKLEIMNRLNKQHGQLEDDVRPSTEEQEEAQKEAYEEEEEGYFSVASDDASSGSEENYKPRKKRQFSPVVEDEGGFVVEDEGGFIADNSEGGFLPENSEGGFFFGNHDGSNNDEEDEGGFITNELPGGEFADDNEATNEEILPARVSNDTIQEEGGFVSGERTPDGGYGEISLDEEGGFLTEDVTFAPKGEYQSENSPARARSLDYDQKETPEEEISVKKVQGVTPAEIIYGDLNSGVQQAPIVYEVPLKQDLKGSPYSRDPKSRIPDSAKLSFSDSDNSWTGSLDLVANHEPLHDEEPTPVKTNRKDLPEIAHPSEFDRSAKSQEQDLIEVHSQTSSPEDVRQSDKESIASESPEVIEISDDSELSRIEKEEQELGLEYSDSE